ncbi:MAG: glycosyltransferase family 10 [Allgaiera sp.]|jgi:hypothetical protein|nr:glycosyltransferase family 10 [Allgaiera sp.]
MIATPTETAIAILPYGVKPGRGLAAMSLDQLNWPLGRPGRLDGARVADLGARDHLLLYPSGRLWLPFAAPGVQARLSLMIVEPEALHARHMVKARRHHRHFHRVLTCNPALLAAIPNGLDFVFGSTWVPDWREADLTKQRMLSLIASAKRDLPGHKLRHEMVDWLRAGGGKADVMGGGYVPFGQKSDGLAPYRYSLVIENVRERGYFTEKLVDALLCRTVPIYWGAPDIASYFDPAGMMICETRDQLEAAVRAMSDADYTARAAALAANQTRAAEFADTEARAARAVAGTL